MMVRVLLCGMGGYGENYVKTYLTQDVLGSELVGIADPFAAKSPLCDQVRQRDIPLYCCMEEFFEHGSADLVVISSPIHTHYPYVMNALEHHCNVLTEKPVCFNMKQYDEMERRSKENGCFVAVGYQLCFSNDVLSLKRDILNGLYGKGIRLKTIRLMRRNDVYYNRSGWAGALMCSGEPVFDSPFSNACAHQFQNMVFLLGKSMDESATVTEVDGSLIKVRPDITNCDTAILKFTTTEGVELFFYASHAIEDGKVGPYSEYEFENGRVVQSDDGFVGHLNDGRTIEYKKDPCGHADMEKLYESVRCTIEKRMPVCTLRTGREHTRAVLMAQEHGVMDLSRRAVALKDEQGSIFYTIEGLSRFLQDCYSTWSIENHVQ